VLVLIGLTIDLLYAVAAGAIGGWVRGSARLERRRRYATGGVYIALAAVALTGSRRAS
jgi:threonine/homoserine/homoserine lactone efflux protein